MTIQVPVGTEKFQSLFLDLPVIEVLCAPEKTSYLDLETETGIVYLLFLAREASLYI